MDDLNEDGSLGYTVLHNSTCQHGAPTYINLMNAAILRLATDNKNMTIQTRNHPLPMTSTQQSQHHVCICSYDNCLICNNIQALNPSYLPMLMVSMVRAQPLSLMCRCKWKMCHKEATVSFISLYIGLSSWCFLSSLCFVYIYLLSRVLYKCEFYSLPGEMSLFVPGVRLRVYLRLIVLHLKPLKVCYARFLVAWSSRL